MAPLAPVTPTTSRSVLIDLGVYALQSDLVREIQDRLSYCVLMESSVTKLDSFKFVRDEVKHEYNVLGSRLTSYITSQSFLVSAFAMAMNNSNEHWGPNWRLFFPAIICATGLVLSGRAQPGITSAVQIINALHERQRELHADPEVRALDFMNPEFMISVHRQSLQFSVLTAYVFSTAWIAMLLLSIYIRFQ